MYGNAESLIPGMADTGLTAKPILELAKAGSAEGLELWGRTSKCQVDRLVLLILNEVPRWPQALELISILCEPEIHNVLGLLLTISIAGVVVNFRDSILLQEPLLLSSLLKKACEAGVGTIYGRAAVAILSTKIPASVALPADTASFLQCLAEEIIREPSSLTLEALYNVSRGCGPAFLELIAQETLLEFVSRLRKTLKESQDTAVYLHCLFIFAHISQLPKSSLSNVEYADMIQAAQHFFTEKRAFRTLDLVVIGVIQAIVAPLDDTWKENLRIQQIALARSIIDMVEPLQRTSWVKNNMVKLRKLCGKISSPGIQKGLRTAAIEFFINIVGPRSVPASIWNIFVQDHAPFSTVSGSIEHVAPYLTHDFVKDTLLQYLTKAIQLDRHSACLIQDLIAGREFIKTLEASRDYSNIDVLLCSMFSIADSQSHLERFLNHQDPPKLLTDKLCQSASPGAVQVGHEEGCPLILISEWVQFNKELCLLLLHALLGTSQTTRTHDLQVYALLDKLAGMTTNLPQYQGFVCYPGSAHKDISFFEVGTTPSLRESLDWRERLVRELSRDASRSFNSIVHSVTEVCRDLELRCKDVEGPLRAERVRVEEMQSQLGAASSVRLENQGQIHEQNLTIRALESEVSLLKLKLEAETVRSQQASNEAQGLRERLGLVEADRQRIVQDTSDAAKEYNAQTNLHEQLIEENLHRIENLEAARDQKDTEISALNSKLDVLREHKSQLENSLHEQTPRNEEDVYTIVQLRKHVAELEAIVNKTKEEASLVENQFADLKALEVGHLRDKAELEGMLDKVCLEHKDEIKDIALGKATMESSLKAIVEDLKREMNEEKESSLKIIQLLQRKVSDLEKKTERLRQDRKRQETEFAEAQELSRKLLAITNKKTSVKQLVIDAPRPDRLTDLGLQTDKSDENNSLRHDYTISEVSHASKRPKLDSHGTSISPVKRLNNEPAWEQNVIFRDLENMPQLRDATDVDEHMTSKEGRVSLGEVLEDKENEDLAGLEELSNLSFDEDSRNSFPGLG